MPAVPRTRAEMRAAREAAEAAEAERISRAVAHTEQAAPDAARPDDSADDAAARDAAAREEAVRRAGDREIAEQEAAARKMAAFEAAARDDVESTALPAIPLATEPVIVGVQPETPGAEPEGSQTPAAEDETGAAEGSGSDDTSASVRESRTAAPTRTSSSRRFVLTLAAVLGVLVLVGTGFGIVSLMQGPRVTNVQSDAAQAIESSGSRVILTANQSLAAIDPAQVTVEPAAPFTVDASGRSIGIRFTVPLDDDTEYTIRVSDVVGAGGGPKTDLTTTVTTPPSSFFLLRRDVDGEDKIFRTDLTGDGSVVFSADKINDFRATSTQLVVAVEEDEGSKLLVMNRDGSDPRELELPGVGYVRAVQVSERGGLVGYSYSDRQLSDTEGRASVLVTQSLKGDDKPQVIEVADKEASVFAWQFVPDSAAVLFLDFDGALSLVDRSSDAGVQSLGLAANIQGVSRGTYTAIVERLDGTVVELNLTDGSEVPLAASDPDYGTATTITPFPGGTLRHVVARNENGIPTGQAIIRVGDDGAAEPLVEVAATDSILQACASPSGQYAAVVIAPDLANNPYDEMLLPLPQNMETHLLDLRTGKEIVALTGFDLSWCQTAPRF
ncbi:hypothetical protein KZC51_01600 [Microbacterium sp. SSW1-49]|uniref:SbsA Ig-like domain-containing protein n=1 Tax=Microbacterium croceum TaxID=2851645 RepID=A0ABT0FAR8_9MICO|nr:hypothetical protein [Microbacterium croceum]